MNKLELLIVKNGTPAASCEVFNSKSNCVRPPRPKEWGDRTQFDFEEDGAEKTEAKFKLVRERLNSQFNEAIERSVLQQVWIAGLWR